jgi:hypothetical protein
MLEIANKLPLGALVGGEERLVAETVVLSGGARFVARENDLILKDGRIIGWREAQGTGEAVAVVPNTGNSRFDAGPPGALLCEKGVNCGFTVPGFANEVEQFSIALIYRSAGDAKTLAGVSTGAAHNVIFLSESDGRILAKDKHNTVELALPSPPAGRAKLVIASFNGRRLQLRVGGQTVSADGQFPGMGHPADFLIGCRSNRPGLTRMLGASKLHEVFFWPDRALLEQEAPEDLAALRALEHYYRWDW